MTLKEELGLKRGYVVPAHEALLNIYYTASMMKKRADDFFGRYGLTDVQFNLMSLLHYESGPPRLAGRESGEAGKEGGLSQAQISDMMLVNRANITSLVDRMEKGGLVVRTARSNDRRFNIIKLTTKGEKLFTKVEPHYIKQVRKVMSSLNAAEMKLLTETLEKIRNKLRQ